MDAGYKDKSRSGSRREYTNYDGDDGIRRRSKWRRVVVTSRKKKLNKKARKKSRKEPNIRKQECKHCTR